MDNTHDLMVNGLRSRESLFREESLFQRGKKKKEEEKRGVHKGKMKEEYNMTKIRK